MSNKLKNIFSNEKFEMCGNLKFENKTDYYEFINALKLAYEQNKEIKLKGEPVINTYIKKGNESYPILNGKASEYSIIPLEYISINTDTERGERNVKLQRRKMNDSIIIETLKNEVILLKFEFDNKNNHDIKFTYETQLDVTKKISDVAEGYCRAIGILNYIFNFDNDVLDYKDNLQQLKEVKRYFYVSYLFWNKLEQIESKLNVEFNPIKIGNIDDKLTIDVEELYLFLIKNKSLRTEYTFSSNSSAITHKNDEKILKIGQEINLTFMNEFKYFICEQTITIYTANLLSNAKIKYIENIDNKTRKIFYGDTDSSPMYISCTGYINKNDAKNESDIIMNDDERIKKYKKALTAIEYYNKEVNDLDNF